MKQKSELRIQAESSCAAMLVVLIKMIGQFIVGFPTKASLN